MDDETGKWRRPDRMSDGGAAPHAAWSARPDTAEVPHAIGRDGRYRVQSRIAETDSSYLYDAWDSFRSRRVAIKQMRMPSGDPEEVRDALIRFEDSAEAGNHPNIVKILKFLELDGNCYIVMEFLEGGSLGERIERIPDEPLRMDEVHAIMTDLLAALEHSHAMDLIHRDVKPANLLLSASGRWKLTDFGIARFRSSTRTQYGTFIGTPAYASPEQVMGRPVDPRTDLYACGVVLYELLTGHRPFSGSPDTVKRRIVQTKPVPPSALGHLSTPALDGIVARAMAKDPDERFESAAAFRAALESALVPAPRVRAPSRPFDDPDLAHYAPRPARDDTRVPRDLIAAVRDGRLGWTSLMGPIAVAIFLVGIGALGWRLLPGSQPTKPARVASAPMAESLTRPLPVGPTPDATTSSVPPPVVTSPVATPPPAVGQPDASASLPSASLPSAPLPSAPSPSAPPLAAPPVVAPQAAPPAVDVPSPPSPVQPAPVEQSGGGQSAGGQSAGGQSAGGQSASGAPADGHPELKPPPDSTEAHSTAKTAVTEPASGTQYVRPLPSGPDTGEQGGSARMPSTETRGAREASGWRQRVGSNPRVPAPSPEDFLDQPTETSASPAAPPAAPVPLTPAGQQVGLLCQPASQDLVSASRIPVTGVPLLVVTGAAVGLPAQRAGLREGDILEKAGPVSKPSDFGWGSCLFSPTTGSRVANVRAWRDGNWRSFVVQLR
jgi:eukaryotic-like serine/threonine-protein kinase